MPVFSKRKSKKNKKAKSETKKESVMNKEFPKYNDAANYSLQKQMKYGNVIRRHIAIEEIKSLQTKFNNFYNRTVLNNRDYFDKPFVDAINSLKKNIDNLKENKDFSNSFLYQYKNLKAVRRNAKRYIKKIEFAFKEAEKNNNANPKLSCVSYKIGSLVDLESISGDQLEEERQNLLYFISELTELKEKISNYHPITKEMERLSLAKSCESYWITYVEKIRELQQINIKKNISTEKNEPKIQQQNSMAAIPPEISELKDDYDSAFNCLKMSLENEKTIDPVDLTQTMQKKLEKIFEHWDNIKVNLTKLDDVQYQGEFSAKLKGGLKQSRDFFGNFIKGVKKVASWSSDVDGSKALLSKYVTKKS